jgi:putative FmdB family regulatory protein
MPIYEFKCKKCGNIFEQLVFSSDKKDKVVCPACGKEDAYRLLSSFSSGSHSSSKDAGGLSSACSKPSSGGFS